jgi:solute carrier family 45 protein 1/2/4
MKRELHWTDFFILSSYSLGLSSAAGIITPILLPYLVALFMPAELQNTYLAILRVIGLAVAMLMQPLAGLFSDRCTSRWGRRRPFITSERLAVHWPFHVIGLFRRFFLDHGR